jgi:hypothetical protein
VGEVDILRFPMKTPTSPDSLAEYLRYREALTKYRSARETFMAARKELRASRIAVMRRKRLEMNAPSKKNVEIPSSSP